MAIARTRAEVMAANDVMSHTEPNGQNVFDRIRDAGLTWYGAGEIIAWNNYPTEYSAAEAIQAWMASPGHHDIMMSTGYNYVGYGAAISATGKRYYAGVFVKEPDETGATRTLPDDQQDVAQPPPRPGHDPLGGLRRAPPGAHLRPPLLRGPAPLRRRGVGNVGHDHRDQQDRDLATTVRPAGPGPGPRQGRQLGSLEGHPHQSLIRPAGPRRSRIARTSNR